MISGTRHTRSHWIDQLGAATTMIETTKRLSFFTQRYLGEPFHFLAGNFFFCLQLAVVSIF